MRFRGWLASVTVACLFWVVSCLFAPMAVAVIQIQLSDLSYSECPPELAKGTVVPGGSSGALANCFLVHGKATNKSGKMVINADIYGRIYDANGNSILQNRTRLGSIDEVPPGVSDFELRITVPANQPTPLKLKQFKASGFTGRVRR
ncbi:MAG TPA: hypothetical protein DDZ80_10740 [Cyanobacteria bacterium UBA8803]|nr:hypothetical protein [Cyanobacteria bacterium UBA9273]HBL58968.1 hypothetical protein [Cyanobacteria bacterium UBA8803]